MKNSSITSLILITIFLTSCQSLINFNSLSKQKSSAESSAESTTGDSSKIIIANYNGRNVTLKDANNEIEKLAAQNTKLKDITFDKLSSNQKEAIIKEVVLKEMAYYEAKKRNLNKDKDYQETLKIFETELLKQKLFATLAKEATEEKNLKKNYDELAEKLKDKKDIRISYIIVKTQSEAEFIYKSLLKYPRSFAFQAKRKSLDKELAKKGGDLGFVMEDSLPAEVLKQARTVEQGQIAQPVQTSGQWIIIKLEDEKPTEILSYEKAKDALAQSLTKKAIEDFIAKSLEKAKISILVK
jgi:parvulin-like peptidyl-prolyl isomerase